VAVVDVGGGVQPDAGVVVVVVVELGELVDEGPGVLQRSESVGEHRRVLQGLVVNTNAGGGE
jgi:hypothetical protein